MIIYQLKKKKISCWFKSKKDTKLFLEGHQDWNKSIINKIEIGIINKELLLNILNSIPVGRITEISKRELDY